MGKKNIYENNNPFIASIEARKLVSLMPKMKNQIEFNMKWSTNDNSIVVKASFLKLLFSRENRMASSV